MPSLYQLDRELETVLNDGLVVDPDTGEILFDSDNLEALEGERNDKLEAVALFIKSLDAEASAIKAEERSLAERRQVKERKADRLRAYLSGSMESFGDTRLETPRCVLSFRKSEAVEVTDEGLIPTTYITYKPSINRAELKKALKSGDEVPGACLMTRQNLQIK